MKYGRAILAITAAACFLSGAAAAGAQESILYSFSSPGCSAQPDSAPVFDSKGNLYGTCQNSSGDGFVYEFSPKAGGGSTAQAIFTFGADGTTEKGSDPNGLIFDAQKVNLFGTTSAGGSQGGGVVYELSPNGSGGWTQTVLYNFGTNGANDGLTPLGSLVFDASGNLYGTTSGGGANFNSGTAFELSPKTGGGWTETVIRSFSEFDSIGSGPQNGLIFDTKGNLYGTTNGGSGTVFELSPAGGGTWTAQPIAAFAFFSNPAGNLIFDGNGNLYGVSTAGGANGVGAVYEWSPTSGSTWTAQTIYSFGQSSTDGASPAAGVIFGPKGVLYGTTAAGGQFNGIGAPSGYGTIFELIPGSGKWTEKILYNFDDPSNNDAFHPDTDLALDAAGNLYGSASGGSGDAGAVFELYSPTTVELPQFSPAPGTYIQSQSVEITDATPNSTIYYTTNGNTPTTGSTKYTSAITVSATETIEAIGVATGLTDSAAVTAKYTITPPAAMPVFSPLGGTYADAQKVTLTDATSGATIYYTTNGTTPTTSSTKYTAEIAVSATETLEAVAIAPGFSISKVAAAAYTIETPAATPVITPAAGSYTAIQTVTITDATSGATIYYTTNGTTPTTASTKYSGAITVATSETIEAIGVASGYLQSAAATAKFTITLPAANPVFSPAGGNYASGVTVTIADATAGATIYYTTDGTTPTGSSEKYSGPIDVSSTETLESIAIAPGHAVSAAATAQYIIDAAVGWREKVLYSFGATAADGSQPQSNLYPDGKGNLFGTTFAGGAYGNGTVFELMPGTSGSWTEKVLHSFGATAADPGNPTFGVIFDPKGNLYGTTNNSVFELTPAANGDWTEMVLFTIPIGSGYLPDIIDGGVVLDKAGNLYGETSKEGPNGCGTVFELSPVASGPWKENVLYNCDPGGVDGELPQGGLIFDTEGNLYGGTQVGGTFSNGDADHGGIIFELTPGAGGAWTPQTLHNFGGANDGVSPYGRLIFDGKGNLFGTTGYEGTYGFVGGTAFELSPASHGTWTEKVLHSFGQGTDGAFDDSSGGLVFDAQGNLYGSTNMGGSFGDGIVFELSPASGGAWTEKRLYNFGIASTDASNPQGSLILDAQGNLYGTSSTGGTHGGGTVFEIENTTVSMPVFSPAAGVYAPGQTVAITDPTPGSTIYYTTNGTTPTSASTKYTSALKLSATETIKAIAVAAGFIDSPVAFATYTIENAAATPVISPPGGKYTAAQTITITDATAGAAIYYTTNGAAPTAASTKYSAAFKLTATATVKAVAIAKGFAPSNVASSAFTIETPAATPVFSPASGTYTSTQSVKITDATAGATIYYTTNGTTPTATSTKYTAPISVAKTTKIEAIAIASGYTNSAVASATYMIVPLPPTITLTPKTLTFPAMASGATSAPLAVTVASTGTGSVTLQSISITGTDSSSFQQVNDCGSTLVQGASCTVFVAFKPSSAGSKTGVLTFADNAGGSPQTVALSGTATAADSVTLSKTSLVFASTAVGTTTEAQSITVTNTGASTLDIASIAISGTNAASFTQVSTCGTTLAPAASCLIYVAFKPATTGALSGSLTIADSGSGSPQSVKLSGTGAS